MNGTVREWEELIGGSMTHLTNLQHPRVSKTDFSMDRDTPNLRILLENVSDCCGKRMFIGRYSTGGFVKSCCERCGTQNNVSARDFEKAVEALGLSCKDCGETMRSTTNVDGYRNYGFDCSCGNSLLVADIVAQLPR